MGFSDALEKAEFYFSMYDMDDDGSLSREEIYKIMSFSHGEVGDRILSVHNALSVIDKDGDGNIDFNELLEAVKREPWLEKMLL